MVTYSRPIPCKIIISCEHASYKIPTQFQGLFHDYQTELMSHLGYDIGAFDLAKDFEILADNFYYGQYSRMLVDLNRSINNRKLFSFITRKLPKDEKTDILRKYYFGYRDEIQNVMSTYIRNKQNVIHISVHSFTPILNNQIRKNHIGLLYDPRRSSEKYFAQLWRSQIAQMQSGFSIRLNYPYLGSSDAFTTYLRKLFSDTEYVGIELEVNQKYLELADSREELKRVLKISLSQLLNSKFIA